MSDDGKMPFDWGCCCCKSISATVYRTVCGVMNPDDGRYYLHYESMCHDAECPGGSEYGTRVDYNPVTCEATDSSIPTPGGCFCCPGCPDGADTVVTVYSSPFTPPDLNGKMTAALALCSFDSMTAGDSADSDGTTCNVSPLSCGLYTVYYSDDETDPSFMQKTRLQFKALTTKYCKTFYPQDGGDPSTTTVSCTIGDVVTVEPPTERGYVYITFKACS